MGVRMAGGGSGEGTAVNHSGGAGGEGPGGREYRLLSFCINNLYKLCHLPDRGISYAVYVIKFSIRYMVNRYAVLTLYGHVLNVWRHIGITNFV